MAHDGHNKHFYQKNHCYSEFFQLSHSIQSEIGQIYSLRALKTDTGIISGQKKAKNGLKWPKLASSLNRSLLIRIFLPISLNAVGTRSNILYDMLKKVRENWGPIFSNFLE